MVKMYEICEGTFVPEECCTFHEPPEGGGHGLSVSGNDIAHLLDALINFVPRNMEGKFNGYARLTGAGREPGNPGRKKAKYATAREAWP